MTPDAHARLTELFGQAIDATAAERDALIARVRRDDPALAAELSALLAADAAPVMHTGALEPTVDERPAPRPHRFAVDGYRILEVLGEGAMGTVYAAEQRAPRRAVAIKVLRGGSLERFAAEAEVMARLDHPGIAKVLEAGEAGGAPYFVMERIEGRTLDVAARALDRRGRLGLVVQAADAIHHAHLNGVIHRDLKPSNLMVRADGRVVVLDFGIARVAGDAIETQAGEVMGTPSYMSPEQARLRPDEVDARSDVYALGVILYELVAGELPYDLQRKSLAELGRIVGETAPRPLRDVHGDLAAIAMKALAKAPGDRYHSAAALADDLRAYLGGDTVSARLPGTLEVLQRAARRRPGTAAAIAAALLATAAFAIVVTDLWLSARAARRAIERERVAAAAARDLLDAHGNQLLLDRARGAVGRDPTEALRWLAAITGPGVDPAALAATRDEARGRGVALEERADHTDELRAIETAGGEVVTVGFDGRALRYPRAGAPAIALWSNPGRLHLAVASPDGALIALAGDAGAVRVVDRAGRTRAEPAGLAGEVARLRWSHDGRWLAAADDAGAVRLWPAPAADGPADERGRALEGPRAPIAALAFSLDDRALIAGDEGGTLWRWDLAGGPPRTLVRARPVLAVAEAGGTLTAVDGGGALVRARTDGDALAVTATVDSRLSCRQAALGPDAGFAIVAADDGAVARLDDGGVTVLARGRVRARSLAISAAGRRVAAGDDDGLVQVWDAGGRHLVLRGHRARVRALAFTPDGRELVSGDGRGLLRRWPIDATPALVLDAHRAAIVALASDGRGHLASADADGALRRWDLLTGASTLLATRADRITALAFAGAAIAAGTDTGALLVWPDEAPPLERSAGAPITALVASADGALIAVATRAGPIALFRDGESVATGFGHDRGTDALALSPDGALLASGGQDRVVRLWRTADLAARPAELGPISDDTRALRFTPDGALLVAGDDDGEVRAWDLPLADGPASAATRAGRRLAQHAGRVLALGFDYGTLISIGRAGDVITTPVPALSGIRTPDGAAARARFAADRLDATRVTATTALPGDRLAVGLADGAILVRQR